MHQPTPQQLLWQRQGLGLFCHFGINTFFGKEWSDGSLPAGGFLPRALDCRQWVQVAHEAGARYLILTAKHHDGFCLWQTETTRYGVASSPWLGGKGDVVAELAEACQDLGMPLGLYLSPWDRNAACYSDPVAYDRFYCQQLTELCTRYGTLFELWFDGAGSEGRQYDWNRIMEVVERHQPDAMVFNMGRPTIRWVGNEDGLASDPIRYVASTTTGSAFASGNDVVSDTGAWLPPECDVALRQHWFWQPDDLDTLKSLEHLLGIWYRSVGLGANLLLNTGPDRHGRICAEDEARLVSLGSELQRRFATPVHAQATPHEGGFTINLPPNTAFDHLELCEELSAGQQLFDWQLLDEAGEELAHGGSIGIRRIVVLRRRRAQKLQLRVARGAGSLAQVRAFCTGHECLPELGAKLDYGAWGAKADRPA